MIIRYDSVRQLREDYIKRLGTGSGRSRGDSWYGGESVADSLRLAEHGDTTMVPEADKLLSQLDSVIDTPKRQWEASPAGAYCVVPEYLAGLPAPMRRIVHTQDESAPITVLAVTTSSGGIDASVLRQRGTVILALVMALARSRPVSLQQLTILDGRDRGETVITAEINTSPLDLATACYVMTSAGFARRLTYDLARSRNDFMGGWPRNFSYYKPTAYYEYCKQTLSPDPARTLVIGAAQLGDEMLKHPVQWINRQILRFTQPEDFTESELTLTKYNEDC